MWLSYWLAFWKVKVTWKNLSWRKIFHLSTAIIMTVRHLLSWWQCKSALFPDKSRTGSDSRRHLAIHRTTAKINDTFTNNGSRCRCQSSCTHLRFEYTIKVAHVNTQLVVNIIDDNYTAATRLCWTGRALSPFTPFLMTGFYACSRGSKRAVLIRRSELAMIRYSIKRRVGGNSPGIGKKSNII